MFEFEAADILKFYGREPISRGIEWLTWGPSHVGIICRFRDLGWQLVESTTLCDLPDTISGKPKPGVQFHDPYERIAAYKGRVEVMRLVPGRKLWRWEQDYLAKWLMHRRDQAYNYRGAPLSATLLYRWTALLPYPDQESVFCSQLCAEALQIFNRCPLRNPCVYNPASLSRELRSCGLYGKPRPLSRVTPAHRAATLSGETSAASSRSKPGTARRQSPR